MDAGRADEEAPGAQVEDQTTDLRDEQGNYSESTLVAINKTTASLEAANVADQELAAMLIKRDTNALAITLEPFAGPAISQKIFGLGVLGMALSTIIILMLINGLAFQEIFTRSPDPSQLPPGQVAEFKPNKAMYFLGCGISGLAGACFPLFWTGEAKAALAASNLPFITLAGRRGGSALAAAAVNALASEAEA